MNPFRCPACGRASSSPQAEAWSCAVSGELPAGLPGCPDNWGALQFAGASIELTGVMDETALGAMLQGGQILPGLAAGEASSPAAAAMGRGEVMPRMGRLPGHCPPARRLPGTEAPAEHHEDADTSATTMRSDYDDPERIFL